MKFEWCNRVATMKRLTRLLVGEALQGEERGRLLAGETRPRPGEATASVTLSVSFLTAPCTVSDDFLGVRGKKARQCRNTKVYKSLHQHHRTRGSQIHLLAVVFILSISTSAEGINMLIRQKRQ